MQPPPVPPPAPPPPPSQPPPQPPPPPLPPRRNWWSRNWKWFVPTGCLSLIVLACVFTTTIVFAVFTAVKSTDAYKIALARAKADERVIQAIGTPIQEGWYVSGHSEVSGGSGTTDLSIPIKGPKGKATIYVVGTKSAGEWQYTKLVVRTEESNETIDLNEAATE